MRGCLLGVLALILIAIVVVGSGIILLLRAPALAASITPVPVSSAAAGSFDRKVATAAGATAPFTVEITEQEATSKFAQALASDPSAPRLDGVQVNFRDGKVYLSGTAREAPFPVDVVVVGRVEARDGRLVSTVEQVDTGPFPLPSGVKEQIAGAATGLDALNNDLSIYVTDLRVLDGRLVLTGRPK